MFRHSLNIICVFFWLFRCAVFKLIGFSPKGRLKMRKVFEFLYILNKTYFLVSVHQNNMISDLTINIRSTVLKKGVFRSVQTVYFKELTCQ